MFKYYSRLLNKVAFVSKCPGHKNSKGELAEWCIKSHDTGEIVSSHKTKEEAKEHLRQMHIHKSKSARETGVSVPRVLLKALSDLDVKGKRNRSEWSAESIIKKLRAETGLGLKFLAKGSSRAVYEINQDLVLKLAVHIRGMAQNEHEYKMYEKVETCSMISRIFYYGEDFSWLISERAIRPVTEQDFKVYGFDNQYQMMNAGDPEVMSGYNFEKNMRGKDIQSVKDLSYLIHTLKLDPGDLWLGNWGIVRRKGQEYPVIVDYGLNDDIYKRFYR